MNGDVDVKARELGETALPEIKRRLWSGQMQMLHTSPIV